MVCYESLGGDILVLVATRNFDLALVVGIARGVRDIDSRVLEIGIWIKMVICQ